MSKPFFYRIDAATFFAEVMKFSSEKELGKFTKQFAIDLVTGNPTTDFSESVICEACEYIRKKREAGKKGGEQRASNAQALLNQSLGDAQASNNSSSSNSSSNSTKRENTLVDDISSPDCPHLEIVEQYNTILPMLTSVKPKLWDGTRKTNLASRWKEDEERQSVEWWKELFNRVAECPFLLGGGNTGWKADLGWMVKKSNFVKILEGKYDQRQQANTLSSRFGKAIL